MASNHMGTIVLVPNVGGDYYDRLEVLYPELAAWCKVIIDDAGTQDADVKVVLSAAKRMADMADWMRRAEDAMQSRKFIQFDRLCAESRERFIR